MESGQGNHGHKMQVKDLDGNTSHWQLIGNIFHGSLQNKSSLHLEARNLIHECFPTLQVLEEVQIMPRRSDILYLDFYLPLIKTCIEVHGEQHYKFSKFFHSSTLGFIRQKKRDQEKQEWCRLNGIKYIELPFDQKDQWRSRIKDEH